MKFKNIYILLFLSIFLFAIGCGNNEDEKTPDVPTVDEPTPEQPDDPKTPVVNESISFKEKTIIIDEEVEIPLEKTGLDGYKVLYNVDCSEVIEFKNNKIIPIKTGKVIITATVKDLTAQLEVYVFLEDISTLDIGEEIELSDIYSYTSSNTEIVSVENNKLIAEKAGSTNIKVSIKDSNIFKEYAVTVKGAAPRFDMDQIVLCSGEEVFIEVLNYSQEDLNWNVSNEDVAFLFEDWFLCAMGTGECELKAETKDGLTSTIIKVIVIEEYPTFDIQKDFVVVGSEIELSITSNYEYEDLLIDVDTELFEIIKNDSIYLKALKTGTSVVKVSLKDYPQFSREEKIEIYPVEPIFNIQDSEITKGVSIKLIVENYQDNYEIEVDNENIVKYEDGLVTGLNVGSTSVKVYLKDEPTKYSTVNITVLPIMPKFDAVMKNILVGSKTGFIINNIPQLDDQDVNNYEYSLADKSAGEIENGIFTAKKAGEIEIIVTNKNDSKVTSKSIINVYDKPTDTKEILISIDNVDGVLQAGEMFPTTILSNYTLDDLVMSTSNDLVLMVNSKGRILAVNAGIALVNIYVKGNQSIKTSITVNVVGLPNTNYVGRLISVAEEEIGYREGPNNDTKYGSWYGLPNEEWCAMFVAWCAKESGISTDIIPKYAGCTFGMNWFKERNRWGDQGKYTPKPGDIIFFSGDTENVSSHTGIVIACDGVNVYTIEGNTSNMVAKREYSLTSTYVKGYGIPNYPKYDGDVGSGDIGGSTGGEGESTT